MDSYREIENLIYRYAELIDSGDFESLSRLFSHAQFVDAGGTVASSSAEEFLKMEQQAVRIYAETGTPRTKHVTSNVIIEVDEAAGQATARAYFSVLQATPDLPLQPIIAGRYSDNFERVDGQWRFQRRQVFPELIGDLTQHLLFELGTN